MGNRMIERLSGIQKVVLAAAAGAAIAAPIGTGLLGSSCAHAQAAAPGTPAPGLVPVPGGHFQMGSPGHESGRENDEGPVHEVRVATFLLMKYPVTRGEFAAFVNDTGYDAGSSCKTLEDGKLQNREGRSWRNPGFSQTDQDPVVCVNWTDAQNYARWLSRRSGQEYRLPTEAEYEYAARAGTTTAAFWGESPDRACDYANGMDASARSIPGISGWAFMNCDDHAVYTSSVGRYRPNAFGLYDMLGNVFEWTQDCYHDSYNGAPTTGSAWVAGDCKYRVVRGGSWISYPAQVFRSAKRGGSVPSNRYNHYGFRLARMN